MIDFPNALLSHYLKLLEVRGVPAASFAECIKWCRYFLDYCDKYPAPISQAKQLPLFIEKLKTKKQSELQCRQATYAEKVFLDVLKPEISPQPPNPSVSQKPIAVSKPLDDYYLCPLRSGHDGKRAQEPARFLNYIIKRGNNTHAFWPLLPLSH
jgi:hypothetical protein